MELPRTIKEIQRLTGCIVALNKFISRAIDKCFYIFKILRTKSVDWRPKCNKAFHDLKDYLGKAPLLAKPINEEKLYLYLSISSVAVSLTLVKIEPDGT